MDVYKWHKQTATTMKQRADKMKKRPASGWLTDLLPHALTVFISPSTTTTDSAPLITATTTDEDEQDDEKKDGAEVDNKD